MRKPKQVRKKPITEKELHKGGGGLRHELPKRGNYQGEGGGPSVPYDSY